MNPEIISIIAFFAIIAGIIIIDRKNIEFGLVIIRRTQKGVKWIKSFAKKHRTFFNAFGNVGMVLGILLSILGFYYLFRLTGAKLILPKIFPGEASETVQNFAFFMPLWYWVISLFLIIVSHELFHGFLFALEKIKIKSTGFLLFLIFPGGFVEPDEEEFKRSNPKTRMRVASVGSIANVFLSIILLIILLFARNIFYQPDGFYISELHQINNTPAQEVNLTGTVTEINGNKIESTEDFINTLKGTSPGETIRIETQEKTYQVELGENPDNSEWGYLGVKLMEKTFINRVLGTDPNMIYSVKNYSSPVKSGINWLNGLIEWTAFISVSVGVANLLPFLPFDGGIMWQALFEKFTKKRTAKKMIKVLSGITYILLFLNLSVGLF